MTNFRKLDAFVKARPEMRNRSAVGGGITLLAGGVAGFLMLAQLWNYIRGDPQQFLHLSASFSLPLIPLDVKGYALQLLQRRGSIPLDLLVTFYHLECSKLDVSWDGVYSDEWKKLHPGLTLHKRTPTSAEWRRMHHGNTPNDHFPQHACTLEGTLNIPRVGGNVAIGMNRHTWAEATHALSTVLHRHTADTDHSHDNLENRYNASHYVHHIRFGETFHYAHAKPLEERAFIVDNRFGGVALEQLDVRLVPTYQTSWGFVSRLTFQTSVVHHMIQPQTLVVQGIPHLPGISLNYDFCPLAVQHTNGRDNFMIFFSNLISIVGGVFVTVALVSQFFVASAQAVAKKLD